MVAACIYLDIYKVFPPLMKALSVSLEIYGQVIGSLSLSSFRVIKTYIEAASSMIHYS